MLVAKILWSMCLVYVATNNRAYGRPTNEITEETRESTETQIPAAFSDSGSEPIKPSEVQKAVCTVTSGDVRASAEAFTTRELKGVCGSMEMLKAFSDLKNTLKIELQSIQEMIRAMHSQFVLQNTIEDSFKRSTEEPITTKPANIPATFKFQAFPIENKPPKAIELSKNYYLTPQLKSLPTRNAADLRTAVREMQAAKYSTNKTVTENKNVKVYTYYWRMENFTENIKSATSLSMESPIFSIRGKAFKIKAHFQHLHRDYLYLQLEEYSSVPQLSLGNSIVLDTGGIFKEINNDNFKYKMSILDQNKKRSSDLVSQEFDNYETGFSIPNSALIDSPFIKNDALLIQLFLYL